MRPEAVMITAIVLALCAPFLPVRAAPISGSGDDAATAAAVCPGSGDCCTANGTPGCDNFDCCDFVCFIAADCCAVDWDEACAGFALVICPDQCGADCPGSGDCCAVNGSPGCNDALCCESVCLVDATCCDDVWDAACVATAATVCTACAPPFDCPNDGDCCTDNGTPGCRDAACCEAVCSLDPRCCDDGWNAECAVTANLLCGGVGEQYCGFCPGTESCCESHASPGCDSEACCNLVCGLDVTCCTDRWSLSCQSLALDHCATSVCDCAVPGDFDGDGLVTLADVAEFQNCYTDGAPGPIDTACVCADFNGDDLVDAKDTQALVAALAGP